MGAGLAEPHEVAAFLAEQEEVLGVCPAQGAVKPPGGGGRCLRKGQPPSDTLWVWGRHSGLEGFGPPGN